MLTHVALDTETLIGAGWPRAGADFENLIASCAAAGIPILVSAVSLVEAETVWLERTGAAVGKASNALGDIRRILGPPVPNIALPNTEQLGTAYQQAAAAGQRLKWQVVDPPDGTARELVDLAARHRPPFGGRIRGSATATSGCPS